MEQQSGFVIDRESNFIISSDRILLALVLFIAFLLFAIWDQTQFYGGFGYIPNKSFTSIFINSLGIILISLFYLAINWKKEKNLIILITLGNSFSIISLFVPFGSIKFLVMGATKLQLTALSYPLVLILILGEIVLGITACVKLIKAVYKEEYIKSSLFALESFFCGLIALIFVGVNLVFAYKSNYDLGFYMLVLGTMTMYITSNLITGDNYPSKQLVESKFDLNNNSDKSI